MCLPSVKLAVDTDALGVSALSTTHVNSSLVSEACVQLPFLVQWRREVGAGDISSGGIIKF